MGRVQTQKLKDGQTFAQRFILEVPSLDDYVFELFTVTHSMFLYPLNLENLLFDVPSEKGIPNPAAFEAALRKFFAHPEVRHIVAALKAQAMAAIGPVNQS